VHSPCRTLHRSTLCVPPIHGSGKKSTRAVECLAPCADTNPRGKPSRRIQFVIHCLMDSRASSLPPSCHLRLGVGVMRARSSRAAEPAPRRLKEVWLRPPRGREEHSRWTRPPWDSCLLLRCGTVVVDGGGRADRGDGECAQLLLKTTPQRTSAQPDGRLAVLLRRRQQRRRPQQRPPGRRHS
jgi:hypothetical protein